MKKVTYFAIFEPAGDGSFGVSFPDLPGCITVGKDFDDAMHMAEEALNLHLYGMVQDGDAVPVPTLPPYEDTDGCVIAPVSVFPTVFQTQMDTRAVKTNVTLPAWLKREAEKKHVNYSHLLEASLLEYLGEKSAGPTGSSTDPTVPTHGEKTIHFNPQQQ